MLVKIESHVLLEDIDAYGHMNNIAYLKYLDRVRQSLLITSSDKNLAENLNLALLVLSTCVNYHSPLFFNDPFTIESLVRRERLKFYTDHTIIGPNQKVVLEGNQTYAILPLTNSSIKARRNIRDFISNYEKLDTKIQLKIA